MKPGEYLLYSQQIKGNKNVSIESLSAIYKQKPNTRLFNTPIAPALARYNLGLKKYDKSKVEDEIRTVNERYSHKIEQTADSVKKKKFTAKRDKKLGKLEIKLEQGNWLMRTGNPPVIYDSSLARQTAEQMKFYLEKKGYFEADTEYKVHLNDTTKFAKVTYVITENKPYIFHKIEVESEDKFIDSLLKDSKRAGYVLLKENENYDRDKIDSERERIDKMMKNNGYFLFSRDYIRFEVDTAVQDTSFRKKAGLADVKVIVLNPEEGQHERFKVDQVFFVTDANKIRSRAKRDTILYNDIHYMAYRSRKATSAKSIYPLKILDSKITIHTGDYYSLHRMQETQKRLSGMDIFKFANILYDTSSHKFTARIYANPLEKYQTSEELGGTVSQGLPGPFASATLKIRNPIGGLGIFELTGRAAIEGQTGFIERTAYASEELGITTSLTFPVMLLPTKFRKMFDPFNPRTKLLISYSFSNRPEYKRTALRGAMSYNWETSTKRRYTLNLFDASFLESNLTEKFGNYLDALFAQGNTLRNSFTPDGFVSSINASYTYNDFVPTNNETSRYWRFFLESGGTTINLFKPLLHLSDNDQVLGRQLYRFYKVSVDYRFYNPVTPTSYIAFRFNTGFANTYGNFSDLPYEKYFFAGGSNSIRAWAPRRLGPGSALPDLTSTTNPFLYEQQGNILIESSLEYRFKVFKYLNMALFVDAGNVWTIKVIRPNSNFAFDRFYKEIALGSGFGFRFDFSFLILRADIGTKLYNPNAPEGQRWVAKNITLIPFNPFGVKQQTLLNIGIGYPF